VFFSDRVPPEARDAYSKDAMSGILGSVMTGMTLPFVIVIARYRLHASKFEVAVLTMAPVVGYVVSLVWANMMQGRRKMSYAVWPWIVARSLFFLVIFATCSKVFVLIVLLFWLIGSIASPAYSELMKEVYPDGDRAKIMGFARVCTVVSYIVVALIAGKLLETVSYRSIFPVAAVFGIVSALVFNRIHANQATGERGTRLHHFIADSAKLLVQDKGFLWFCMAIFIFGFANFMASPAYALYEVDVLKAREFRQSIYTLVVSAISVISYFYWGSYLDRRRPEKVVAWQIFAWAFIPLTYLVAAQWWMLLPAKVLAGFIGAGTDLVYFTGVMFFAPPNRVSQYYAVFLTLMGIRGIVAPLLGGALLQWHLISLTGMFGLSSAIIFASVVVQMVGYRKYPTAGGHTDEQGDCAN
jgi:MFS family permease